MYLSCCFQYSKHSTDNFTRNFGIFQMIVQCRYHRNLDFSTFQSYSHSASHFLSLFTEEDQLAAFAYLFTLSNEAHYEALSISKSMVPFGTGQVFFL